MTRRLDRTDIAPIAARVRKTAEVLITPCRCGATNCTIGEHVFRSTKDMEPGPRSAAVGVGGHRYDEVEEPDGRVALMPVAIDQVGEAAVNGDSVAGVHAEYLRLLAELDLVADELDVFLLQHRPDRFVRAIEATSADDWCKNHLARIGTCEPVHGKTGLCRWCNEAALIYDPARKEVLPPEDLLRIRHEQGPRAVTQAMFDQYMSAEKRRLQGGGKKKKRRK